MIDQGGRITSPHVLKTLPAPTVTYCALEAVKRWRFEPGKLNGEPVPVIFNLTINFKL